jgi:hypothetical protein
MLEDIKPLIDNFVTFEFILTLTKCHGSQRHVSNLIVFSQTYPIHVLTFL